VKTPERYLEEWVSDEIYFDGKGGASLKIFSRMQIERLAQAIQNGLPDHALAVFDAAGGEERLSEFVAGEVLDWGRLRGINLERFHNLTPERLAWYEGLDDLLANHYRLEPIEWLIGRIQRRHQTAIPCGSTARIVDTPNGDVRAR
jgi:hypothetical protein